MVKITGNPGQVVGAQSIVRKAGNLEDERYRDYIIRVRDRFLKRTALGQQLFTTDADDLWNWYLSRFPEEERQYHNCNACREFVERFGGLVTISEDGDLRLPFWDMGDAADQPELLSVAAMIERVRRSRVTGVFCSSLEVYGRPSTGQWRHLSLLPNPKQVFKHATQSDSQHAAEKLQDFQQVSRALGEFQLSALEQVVALLEGDALYRSEKVLGPARWLRDLQAKVHGVKGPRRQNLIWRAVASAPAGFCHPRSSMIGTLLDDLSGGMEFEEVARRFRAKMSPVLYQRPQAAPTAGNIARAEELFEKMGLARSLERRFARLDEVEAVWRPTAPTSPEGSGGLFGHLTPKGVQSPRALRVAAQPITWERFRREVLPKARRIEIQVPAHGNFAALVTSEHADAPPILQWDLPERRNPVNIYCYHHGSPASQWRLGAHAWAPVTAVTSNPAHWYGGSAQHHSECALFVIRGAVDAHDSGLAIFPETLRGELREVRSTIEAHSKTGRIRGRESASACGLLIGSAANSGLAQLLVYQDHGIVTEYRVDRWV